MAQQQKKINVHRSYNTPLCDQFVPSGLGLLLHIIIGASLSEPHGSEDKRKFGVSVCLRTYGRPDKVCMRAHWNTCHKLRMHAHWQIPFVLSCASTSEIDPIAIARKGFEDGEKGIVKGELKRLRIRTTPRKFSTTEDTGDLNPVTIPY